MHAAATTGPHYRTCSSVQKNKKLDANTQLSVKWKAGDLLTGAAPGIIHTGQCHWGSTPLQLADFASPSYYRASGAAIQGLEFL